MAERPVFFHQQKKVFEKTYTFEWFPGFSLVQKQRSVESLHEAIRKADPDARPLEVSTKSRVPLGVKLSAFRLRLHQYTLENIFQSAKVFEHGGPYPDLLAVPPKEAKHDARLKTSGNLTAFRYQGEDFPLNPKTLFYDYIYFSAVKESLTAGEIQTLAAYSCFTDIEFNPAKSINTQARTASLLALLVEEYGCLPEFSKDEFLQYHREHVVYAAPAPVQTTVCRQ